MKKFVGLLQIAGPQISAIIALLLLAAVSGSLQSASRAYIAGEGQWSKGQKEAVLQLLDFAETGNQTSYLAYEKAIGKSLGDRQARLELEKPDPDDGVATDGFLKGQNHANDIPGMITLFRWFRFYPSFKQAVALWAEGDLEIAKLQQVAAKLRTVVQPQSPSTQILAFKQEIKAINARLAPLEDDFSEAISKAARELSLLLNSAQVALAAWLIWSSARVSVRQLIQSRENESRLAQLSRQFELAANGSNDGIWDWEIGADDMYYSARTREQFGYPPEPPGPVHKLWAMVHEQDAGRIADALDCHLRGQTSLFDEQCRLKTFSGAYGWYRLRAKALRDTHGKPLRLSGVVTDISARINAETELRASEAFQRALLEAVKDVVVVIDENNTIRFANDAVELTFGYLPKEVIGQPLALLQPEKLRHAHDAGFAKYLKTGVKCINWRSAQATARHKDGHEFPIEISFSEISTDDGRRFAAFIRDLTPWKLAQAELKRAKSLLDATQVVSLVGGWEVELAAGNRVYWTDQLYRMLGLSPETYQPVADSILDFFTPESRRVIHAHIDAVENYGLAHDFEVEVVTARGNRIWVHIRSQLLVDEDGTSRRVSTLRDVTREKNDLDTHHRVAAIQRRTSEQLHLTLTAAEVALWGFNPQTGHVTHAQRWEMFGYAEMPATFDDWQLLVHPEDVGYRLESLQAYLRGGSPSYEEEFRMKSGSGAWVWVRSRGRVVKRNSRGMPTQYAGVVMNISDQVAARQIVKEQRNFLEAMVEGIDMGVMVSTETRIVYVNVGFKRMLGYEMGDRMEGMEVFDLIRPEDKPNAVLRRMHLSSHGHVPTWLLVLRCKSGQQLRAAANLSRVVWNGQPHFISMVTLLAEDDNLAAQMRANQGRYERVLISELEAQQAHIARELHESLGSELAGLSLLLGGLQSQMPPESAAASQMSLALRQVQTSADVTRSLARGLMPVGDSPGGFWRAMERLAEDFGSVTGVGCDFSTHGNVDEVPFEVGNHLYRITQEAVTNAVRHGKASLLMIRLQREADTIQLSIADNGSGFDLAMIDLDHRGMGIRSMMARVKTIEGHIQFSRSPNGGTQVLVTCPSRVSPGQN